MINRNCSACRQKAVGISDYVIIFNNIVSLYRIRDVNSAAVTQLRHKVLDFVAANRIVACFGNGFVSRPAPACGNPAVREVAQIIMLNRELCDIVCQNPHAAVIIGSRFFNEIVRHRHVFVIHGGFPRAVVISADFNCIAADFRKIVSGYIYIASPGFKHRAACRKVFKRAALNGEIIRIKHMKRTRHFILFQRMAVLRILCKLHIFRNNAVALNIDKAAFIGARPARIYKTDIFYCHIFNGRSVRAFNFEQRFRAACLRAHFVHVFIAVRHIVNIALCAVEIPFPPAIQPVKRVFKPVSSAPADFCALRSVAERHFLLIKKLNTCMGFVLGIFRNPKLFFHPFDKHAKLRRIRVLKIRKLRIFFNYDFIAVRVAGQRQKASLVRETRPYRFFPVNVQITEMHIRQNLCAPNSAALFFPAAYIRAAVKNCRFSGI